DENVRNICVHLRSSAVPSGPLRVLRGFVFTVGISGRPIGVVNAVKLAPAKRAAAAMPAPPRPAACRPPLAPPAPSPRRPAHPPPRHPPGPAAGAAPRDTGRCPHTG